MYAHEVIKPGAANRVKFSSLYKGPVQIAGITLIRHVWVAGYTDSGDGAGPVKVNVTALGTGGVVFQTTLTLAASKYAGGVEVGGPAGAMAVIFESDGGPSGQQLAEVSVATEEG